MKRTSTVCSLAGLVIASGLFMTQPALASGKTYGDSVRVSTTPEEEPATKEAARSRNFTSLNNNSVRIHPAIIRRQMHVVAKENDGTNVDFFVFDLQGTLLQHYKMKPKSHYKLTGLKKGQYVYSVFQGDEETASGKFEIR
ncbi:MAG: hypothetical protein HYZ15_01480 [Sphingobacteriales bacterium]|nr:hypothetical protein [Sphingobacteriales bacterium]